VSMMLLHRQEPECAPAGAIFLSEAGFDLPDQSPPGGGCNQGKRKTVQKRSCPEKRRSMEKTGIRRFRTLGGRSDVVRLFV
jgi:hypothetical protein